MKYGRRSSPSSTSLAYPFYDFEAENDTCAYQIMVCTVLSFLLRKNMPVMRLGVPTRQDYSTTCGYLGVCGKCLGTFKIAWHTAGRRLCSPSVG